MSPNAVTERLRLMDQLWLLSVKLMRARRTLGKHGETEVSGAGDSKTAATELVRGIIVLEEDLIVGTPSVFDSSSSENSFAVIFEDDGETGYFYALDTALEVPILDAVHIYTVANVSIGRQPSRLQIAWSNDGLKSALIINDYIHAVFDFDSKRGYCRTGFPPITDWSEDGHEWDDEAIGLFS